MADNFSQNRETIRSRDSERPEKKDESSKEVGEKRQEFIEGISEVVEGAEIAEISEGNVSEKSGEGKKKVSGGGIKGMAEAVQKLSMPDLDVMVIQISTRIKRELADLEKERKSVLRDPKKFSPFRLNQIIMRIRELRDILAELATQTADNIKQLWQRFVKGNK